MVRAPCCEKMGLKKGPWTPEEDRTLIGYIQRYGHGNWRALPKQAGLLRCGKSCRLRWTNYLRPDIKRGNFSQDEEDTIINLHEMLGNRWSAIAARLPGRTDNEIKNVWHTHLKKRLKQNPVTLSTGKKSSIEISKNDVYMVRESEPMNFPDHQRFESYSDSPVSPQQSSNENSSGTESSILTSENHNMGIKDDYIDSTETTLQEINENFWSEELSSEISCLQENFQATTGYPQLQLLCSPASITESVFPYSSNSGEEMDFWYNLLRQAGELPDLTEL